MKIKGYWRIVIPKVKMLQLPQAAVVAMQSMPTAWVKFGEGQMGEDLQLAFFPDQSSLWFARD